MCDALRHRRTLSVVGVSPGTRIWTPAFAVVTIAESVYLIGEIIREFRWKPDEACKQMRSVAAPSVIPAQAGIQEPGVVGVRQMLLTTPRDLHSKRG